MRAPPPAAAMNTGLILEPEKPRLRRLQLFLQASEPAGMGEVAAPHHLDTLDPRPGGKSGKVAPLAGRPGIGGMDMEIGDIVHGPGLYRFAAEKTRFQGCTKEKKEGIKNSPRLRG